MNKHKRISKIFSVISAEGINCLFKHTHQLLLRKNSTRFILDFYFIYLLSILQIDKQTHTSYDCKSQRKIIT